MDKNARRRHEELRAEAHRLNQAFTSGPDRAPRALELASDPHTPPDVMEIMAVDHGRRKGSMPSNRGRWPLAMDYADDFTVLEALIRNPSTKLTTLESLRIGIPRAWRYGKELPIYQTINEELSRRTPGPIRKTGLYALRSLMYFHFFNRK